MDCEGTEGCPPRCPRYVGTDGRIYTIRPLADAIEAGMLDTDRVSADADFGLAVENSGAAVAWATHDPEGPATISIAEGTDPEIGTELGRQFVTRRRTDGFDELTLLAPPDVLSPLDAELGSAAVSLDEGDVLAVDLTADPVARLTLAPAKRADLSDPVDFSPLFEPEVIAVVGATDGEGTIGRLFVENLRASFDGRVIPVTDEHDTVADLETVPAIGDLADEAVDLAIILPTFDAVDEVTREAADAGIAAIAVFADEFGGSDETVNGRESELRDVLEDEDVTLFGPNLYSVLSTRSGLNARVTPGLLRDGGVSVLSHSNALLTATLEWARESAVGIRDAVSIGTGPGIDEEELLRYWGSDPDTAVVAAFLEDVGGRPFVNAARAITTTTPVVALKSRRDENLGTVAPSDTVASVGGDSGYDAAFEAAGVIRAGSQTELYDIALAFDRQPIPSGSRVAVITNAAGPADLAADAVIESDCSLATLSEETRERLDALLPDGSSTTNPVTVPGDADPDRFVRSFELVVGDPGVDAAMVVPTPHPFVSMPDVVSGLGEAADRYGIPVVTCFSGERPDEELRDALADASVPNYPDAERAARVLEAMARYDRVRRTPVQDPVPVDADRVRAGTIVREAGESSTVGIESMELLDAYEIRSPRGTLTTSGEEAVETADGFDRTATLTVVSPTLANPAAVGGVAVDVPPDAVGETYEELLETVEANAPSADIRGVYVQETIPDGIECLVGVTRHPRFGPLVTFGLGEVPLEEPETVVHGLAPLSRDDAVDLVDSLAVDALDRDRGQDGIDRETLIDTLVRLSWIPVEFPAIDELEVDPLIATTDGAYAVDLHGTLSPKGFD